jgi:hypothetical protein
MSIIFFTYNEAPCMEMVACLPCCDMLCCVVLCCVVLCGGHEQEHPPGPSCMSTV